VIHGVKPVGKVLGQMVPKSGRKEWFEIPSELAHHEGPTNFGCPIPSRFSKQGFDDERYHQSSATHLGLASLKSFFSSVEYLV